MKYYPKSSRVAWNANEVDTFASRWPGSGLRGAGPLWFEFARNGDVVDMSEVPDAADGSAVSAMIEDSRKFRQGYLDRLPVFVTWTFKGLQFIAVPDDHNPATSVRVLDANGVNYGAWYSVKSFRTRQRLGTVDRVGTAALQVYFPATGAAHRGVES